MLRPRVSLTTTIAPAKKAAYTIPDDLDISVQVADIDHTKEGIDIPTILAEVVRTTIASKAPSPPRLTRATVCSPLQDIVLVPFVGEPTFSGADVELDSDQNKTIISRGSNNVRIKCDTILLGLDSDIQCQIYLTGKEFDLPIDNQRCTVDVFHDVDGYSKKLGVIKRDAEGFLYIEVQEKGRVFETGSSGAVRFHVDTLFSI